MANEGRFSKVELETVPRAAPAQEQDAWPNLDEHGCVRMGDDEFQQGLYDSALTSYSRALRFNRNLPSAWVGQIRCLICLGEYPEAVTWSDRALERFKNNGDLLACKGLSLVLRGDVMEGMEYMDGALEQRSATAWVWLARGEALLAARQPEPNVNRCFLKAIELAATAWEVELRVGMAYNRAKLYARSQPHLLSAIQKAPTNPLALYHLGLAFEGLGDKRGAAGYYQRAITARRSFTEALTALERVRKRGFFATLRGKG